MPLFDAARLALGRLFGTVFSPQPSAPLPDFAARDYALERLRTFLSLVTFSRTGGVNEAPIAYQLPKASIFIEQPDDPQNLHFPAIGILPGRGVHDTLGLGPADLLDETLDVYGPGTALLHQGEYTEPLTFELWGNHPAERRSLLAGLQALFRLSERSQALTLTLPDYYDRVVTFRLDESQNVDDPDIVRGRRRAQVAVEMCLPEVLLVNALTLRPALTIEDLGPDVALPDRSEA